MGLGKAAVQENAAIARRIDFKVPCKLSLFFFFLLMHRSFFHLQKYIYRLYSLKEAWL